MSVRQSEERGVRAYVDRALQRGEKGAGVSRALGFWVLWHTYGGVNGILEAGVMSRRNAYYLLGDFKKSMGVGPDEWRPDIGEAVRAAR